MIRQLIGATLVSAAALLLATGATPASYRELRSHWRLVSDDDTTYFTVTTIRRLDESEDRTIYLVADGDGKRVLEISMIQSYWQQKSIKEIKDPDTKTFIRMEYSYPYKSKTRSGTIAESKSSPEKKNFDPQVTFASSGMVKTALESEWKVEKNGMKWRGELRKATDAALLEKLETLRSSLFSAEPQLRVICDQLVSRFLYGESCAKAGVGKVQAAMPECFFDAEFGYPCSTTQRNRVTQATRAGDVLESY